MRQKKIFARGLPYLINFALLASMAGCNLPGIVETPGNAPLPGDQTIGLTATAFPPQPQMTPLTWDDVIVLDGSETQAAEEPVITGTPEPTWTVEPSSSPTYTATLQPTETIEPTLIPSATLQPAPTETNQTFPTETATPLPSETSQPPVIYQNYERPTYNLNVTIDYDNHQVSVSEVVMYTNQTGQSLSYLLLGVNSNLWNNTFQLYSVRLNESSQTYYELIGQNLNIYPPTAVQPGETVKLELEYRLNLPYSTGKLENFGYTARQMNLTDWYPFVPPYEDGAWLLPAPHGFGENLVYQKADFTINLAVSNAMWQPVVAASALPVVDSYGYHYTVNNARNFTLSLSPEFQVISDQANGVQIEHYYFAESAAGAQQVLAATKQAIFTYSEAFGPYPHSSLTIVETELNDGLELDGLYFLSRAFYQSYAGGYKNNLSVIAIHETAHQWWYGAVASDQANEPWLDEALCTYSERVFFAHNYPDDLQWWWNFRVYSHSVGGYVDSRIYDHSLYSQYVSAVYFNGVEFLDLLRQRVGGESFGVFLREYYSQNNGGIADADDFFNTLSAVSGTYYMDLVQSYFLYR